MAYAEPKTVKPKIAVSHGGLCVYHTYRGGYVDGGTLRFWFTLNPDDLNELDHFDVRDLPSWNENPQSKGPSFERDDRFVQAVLCRAIEKSEIFHPIFWPV
jgi:hypothetical protein